MKYNITIEKKDGTLWKFVKVRAEYSPYKYPSTELYLFMKKRAIKKALKSEKQRFNKNEKIESYTVEG